ncbi:cardiac-enriched FHL2-interacting protein [Vanacampus margaritifer]
MTSVKKRRSNRKNGGHRKHSDGSFSDTSSGGSFLDETDREVRSLTDKAFRSLCIGEEAVYNDSDLGPSSPCIQRDRQRAFNKSGLEKENGDKKELKRAAHESFSLMVQQYEQDWIHDGMYGAEMNRNPQWDVYGDGTQGRVSATFQQSLMEMTQEDRSLEEDPLSYFSNGATDLSLQHRRSRSRVSSLIRAFNSEDGAVMEDQLREWNDEACWNRPDLMNMPSPYQQNFTNGHFSMVGQFSSQANNLYSSEEAAVSHMNAASSFMGLTYNNQHMMTQLDCNTNFFIHSEFSPFRVWQDHNRFQQGEVSRYMQCSEFPKWGQTPMYKDLSLESQMNGSSMFQERSGRHHRTMIAPVAPNPSLRSISTSTRLQKACALEKRCESEQAVHCPQRIRTQSLGTNRLPSQRPSTASPTVEMSYYVQETLSSVEALHQQIKIMTEQNNPEKTANRHGVTPSNVGQLLLPLLPMSQAEPSESRQNAGSPQIVEHPPVRSESRGATPDVRTSSYKSRASSLLFNLKDNRKRVKSTYSPAKFKGCETTEKSREPPFWESKDIVIDIPEYLQADVQESSWTDGASHQYIKSDHSPRLFSPGMNSQLNTRQVLDYKTAQRQDGTVHQSGYIPENYSNGQNLNEDWPLFVPFKQDVAGIQVGGQHHVKSDPNKVDRVKIELAKAKVELAKIKEKMNAEHKGKVRCTIITKEELVANKYASVETNSASVRNPERKHKSERLKAMPHKEKTQTKQEILTSKIKAHAEKEISALMEGFALREVFTSKTATKPLTASQNLHLMQKPPSHEMLGGHGISISSNITTKHQTGSSKIEDKAPPSSEGESNKTVSQLQKELLTESMKSNDPTTEVAPTEMKMTPGYSTKSSVAEDSLQIMGIIVTEKVKNDHKVLNAEESKQSSAEPDTSFLSAKTQSVTPSLEEDVAPAINPSKICDIEDKSAPLLEVNRIDSSTPQFIKTENSKDSKHKESNLGIMNQLEDVHIDNIVIRVLPAAIKIDSVDKHQSTTCSDVAAVEEHQHEDSSSVGENMSTSIKNLQTKYPASEGCEEQKKEKFEDKLSVQDVLDSVRKLADSMKTINQHNNINTTREDTETDIGQIPVSKIQASEGDYFQVQGIPEAPFKNNTHTDVSGVSKVMEHSDQPSDQNMSASSPIRVQNESMQKHTKGVTDKNSQSDRPSELQNCEKMASAQTVDVRKQQPEFRSSLSVRERHNARNSQPTKQETEVKSKPKDRVTTIPEISALADYARLKVIVSEDRENTIQEFPPHKKEGFFPLIQSRHSRRPVFTADLQEQSVKDRSVPKKTEVNTKINKEPKPVVFPITEKEHQRTGMFKLGEKDRPDKTISDVKDHEGVLQQQLQLHTHRKNPKAQVKNEVNREEVPKVDGQLVGQQSTNHMQAPTPSASLNLPRESPQSQQQNQLDTPNPNEKLSSLTSINSLVLRDKNSSTKPTVEPIYQDSISKIRNVVNKDTTGERKIEKSRRENLETFQEETKAKREESAKQQQKEGASKRREDAIAEDIKAKIEERRAFISEERRRAQREAARWEKLKETAQKMEEERKGKQIESRRTNAIKDERRFEREGGKTLKAQEQMGGSISVGERNRMEQRLGERTAQEEEQIRALLMEEQRLARRIEERRLAEETRIKKIQEHHRDTQRREKQKKVEQMTRDNTDTTDAAEKPNTSAKLKEEQLAKGERAIAPEELLKDDDIAAKSEEEHLTAQREKASTSEEQKRAALLMDALQYYTITSTDKKPKERQALSPLSLQQKKHSSVPAEDFGSHRRLHRPHAPPSPAPSLPRSNTSSPALGGKPLMFRVKDNTKGSSFTKSVKPRFHKNFAEEPRVGSPMEGRSERREVEQEIMRRNTGTPINPDIVPGLNRLTPINESSVSQPASSQEYSAPLPHHRPFSRRSIALDEDDSRSVISNMSEDGQSFSTGAADVADLRGLYDYERPVSACSFSSDMSRLGKPPAVPPKSDKALRRAQRLTTRRIRKDVTQSAASNPAENPQQEATSRPASASTEVRSSNRHAMASPHFAPPVSLTHAPTFGPSLPSTHTENLHSRLTFHASPHAAVPVSLSVTSPHVTAPVSYHASAQITRPAAPKTVQHVPSSPTVHYATHPAPVSQYHVESSYPQSYPLTQRKVLQDLGSGQYFLVDAPIEVKMKTFFDPETGKYVQLNVRESGQNIFQPHLQPVLTQPLFPQLNLQPKLQLQQQHELISHSSPAENPFTFYKGYQAYPQVYKGISSMPSQTPPSKISVQEELFFKNNCKTNQSSEIGQKFEGQCSSPEQTPYMDTVNETNKIQNTVYSTHDSFPECNTNKQLAGSLCENDNSAHSRCQPCDIISMSELDDFMEMTDW